MMSPPKKIERRRPSVGVMFTIIAAVRTRAHGYLACPGASIWRAIPGSLRNMRQSRLFLHALILLSPGFKLASITMVPTSHTTDKVLAALLTQAAIGGGTFIVAVGLRQLLLLLLLLARVALYLIRQRPRNFLLRCVILSMWEVIVNELTVGWGNWVMHWHTFWEGEIGIWFTIRYFFGIRGVDVTKPVSWWCISRTRATTRASDPRPLRRQDL